MQFSSHPLYVERKPIQQLICNQGNANTENKEIGNTETTKINNYRIDQNTFLLRF